MIQLRENALIQYHDDPQHPTVERVLYIDPTLTYVVVFDTSLRRPHILPVQRTYQEVVGALNGNQAHLLGYDPFEELLTRNESDIPEHYRERRDRAWEAIRPLVLNDDGSLRLEFFDPEERHKLISTAAKQYVSQPDDQQDGITSRSSAQSSELEDSSTSIGEQESDRVKYARKKVYEWVRKWWRGGMRPNALLPYWHLCGSKDGQRTVTKRLGRPTKESLRQGEPLGVNIDAHTQDRKHIG